MHWVLGALSPGVKWPGYETGHSPPFSVELKNLWSYTFTLPYVFMARCLMKHRNFTFTFNSASNYLNLVILQVFPAANVYIVIFWVVTPYRHIISQKATIFT
jgi:hypothetical protein